MAIGRACGRASLGVWLWSALGAGCTLGLAGEGGAVSVRSQEHAARLEPSMMTGVYHPLDDNTADVYLSDLAPEELLAALRDPGESAPGVVMHLHVFLFPKAGRTPIDFTASNSSLTMVVLTGSSAGVYGGGGFVLPRGRIGDESFSGRARGLTLRLLSAPEGFVDRLGLSEVDGQIRARRDDALAQEIGGAMTALRSKLE